jgi:4-carboxymuconolactone decarboxylase
MSMHVIAVGITIPIAVVSLLAAASVSAQSLVISRAGSRPVRPAPPQNFTGAVQVEMLFDAVDPSHASGGTVTFAPRARTAWHTHPRGQILVITDGVGRVQRWGDPVEEVRAGDVVRIPAGQKHWHGASPHAAMTHLAISEHRDGSTVQWLELVSDEQYHAAVRAEQDSPPQSRPVPGRPSGEVQPRVAPGMATLTDDVLFGDVWRRPELSPRDRSLVTITVLIATGKAAVLSGHLNRALDNGVLPSEASGVLAHLAVYAGWPSAVAALEAYDQVYATRKVDTATLRVADAARATGLTASVGAVAPKFAQLTNDVVFGDLWRRPDLSLRDRSLVTIVALAAMGDDEHLEFYVDRGRESGLTREQVAEALTHLGFYAGWSKAARAMTAIARLPSR